MWNEQRHLELYSDFIKCVCFWTCELDRCIDKWVSSLLGRVCVCERNGLRPRGPCDPLLTGLYATNVPIHLSVRPPLADWWSSNLTAGSRNKRREKWAVWLIWCPQPWDYLQKHTHTARERFPTPLNPARWRNSGSWLFLWVSFLRIVRESWETCLETDVIVRDRELLIVLTCIFGIGV